MTARTGPGADAPPRESEEGRVCSVACGLDLLGASLASALERRLAARGTTLVVASGGCAAAVLASVPGEPHRAPLGTPLPYALGLGAANPDRDVLALLGDGEAAGPGLGHLMHAARRADRVRALVVNNQVLGGGGGFPSAATPRGGRTVATPAGTAEGALDLVRLAVDAGAAWVGRETVTAGALLDRLLEEFLLAPCFALLEVRAPCYPAYGQWNGYATPEAMHEALEREAVRGRGPDAAVEQRGRFMVGRLWPPVSGGTAGEA